MLTINDFKEAKEQICIIGAGYVGLPLAVLFSQYFKVVAYDNNKLRIEELTKNFDRTLEISEATLIKSKIEFSCDPEVLKNHRFIIVTVPTPVDEYKVPDLRPVREATATVGKYLQKGSIVVYESTVYPGVTEDLCVPILEAQSGLKWKQDFNVSFSPERVNPGDKLHTTDNIVKVVSGDTAEVADFLAEIYGTVITAGIHKASSIKVAESAKVIENIQRDINIALINELSLIFDKLNIDTKEVLAAAGTKWNFLKFEPGLVGGHCIGVDPYYLTFKAQGIGYHPELILAGRRINDGMGKYIAEKTVKKLIEADSPVKGSKILILGLTFKENIRDIRNTKVIDIYHELESFGANVYLHDCYAYKDEVKHEYKIALIDDINSFKPYDAVICAVKHKEYLEKYNLKNLKELYHNDKFVLIDIKGIYDKNEALNENYIYWRL